MTHTTQHNAATLHAALMAAAAAAPEFQNNEIGHASCDVSNASQLRAVYFDDGLIDRIHYAQRMGWKETQGEWLIQTTMEETFSELAATCDQSPRHVKFQTATGRIKLVNTAERLQGFADAMAKSKTAWTLWGGGAMPAELAKPKKAKPANTWQTTSVNVCVQLFEDKLHADGLAMALDRLGGRAYWHNEPGKKNEPFLMIAPQPVAGLPERLASGRHAIGGAWSVYDTISGLAIGNSYKPARSRAAAERLALDLLSEKTPEQLETAFNRAKPNDAAEALARLCQVLKIDDTAEALAAAQAQADADALAAEAQAAAPVATVESEFSWMTAAPAAKSVVIPVATPDDTTAEQWALTAAIVHAALVFERCTNILNYDAARRAAIESGRQGKPGAVAYIKAGLLPYTTTGIARHEAKAALNRLAQAEADALAAEAQAAAPAADTTRAAPVATPADAVAALVADAVAAVAIDAAQETARGAELATFAEPEWSKKWAADMADAMAQIEAMKAEREAKRIERMQAAADASTDADADTCTADAVADATEAQASTATGTATPGHTTAPRAMASTAGAQPGHSGGRGQLVAGKSGRWVATFHTTAARLPGMLYTGPDGVASAHEFDTGSARMAALQRLARVADATQPATPATPTATAADEPTHEKAAATPHTPLSSAADGQETPPVCAAGAPDYTHPVETLAADYTDPFKTSPVPFDFDVMTPRDLVGVVAVYTGDMANEPGRGAVVAVDVARGTVDVMLEDGRHDRGLSLRLFGNKPGDRFSLQPLRHGADYLAALAAAVATRTAQRSAAKAEAARVHLAERERLAVEFAHLERAENNYKGGVFAARNMRTELKRAFPGVKFSIKSDYSSVHVRWTDGPTDAQVGEVIGRFDIGASDSQSDYFYTISTAFSELFGGVQYLNTHRETSDAFTAEAIAEFWAAEFADVANAPAMPTAEDWRKNTGFFDWRADNWQTRNFRDHLAAKAGPLPATAKATRKAKA